MCNCSYRCGRGSADIPLERMDVDGGKQHGSRRICWLYWRLRNTGNSCSWKHGAGTLSRRKLDGQQRPAVAVWGNEFSQPIELLQRPLEIDPSANEWTWTAGSNTLGTNCPVIATLACPVSTGLRGRQRRETRPGPRACRKLDGLKRPPLALQENGL